MDFRFVPMTEEFAKEIASWHYTGAYSFYDLASDEEDLQEFMEPSTWAAYSAVLDENGRLVGYFDYTRREHDVEIGLGMQPDLTGRGLGERFVRAGLDVFSARLGADRFTLRVAQFNARAIKVYERVGFREVERFMQKTNGGEYPFVRMALRWETGQSQSEMARGASEAPCFDFERTARDEVRGRASSA